MSIVTISLLVNDSLFYFFESPSGLRQGTLLSPSLFVLIMKTFNCFVTKVTRGDFFYDFKVRKEEEKGRKSPIYSFNYDKLLFCDWLWTQFWCVKIENKLEEKWKVPNIEEFTSLLGSKVVKLPSSYLFFFFLDNRRTF